MRSVLVTGASTGIGRAAALRLDAAGWRVFAGVRREGDAAALREAASGGLEPLFLDVTDAGQVAAAAELIGERAGDGLTGLVNNAGVAIPSPLETIPIDDFRRQLEINLTGHVAVTQALLPEIRRAGGRVVFISSVARAIEHALGAGRPRSRYPVGLDAKVQARLKPLIPTPVFDRIVARVMDL